MKYYLDPSGNKIWKIGDGSHLDIAARILPKHGKEFKVGPMSVEQFNGYYKAMDELGYARIDESDNILFLDKKPQPSTAQMKFAHEALSSGKEVYVNNNQIREAKKRVEI